MKPRSWITTRSGAAEFRLARQLVPKEIRSFLIITLLILTIAGGALLWHLSPAQAAQQGSLVGYWPLNESTGTIATDISGSSNNGTYSGNPTPNTDVPTTSFPDSHSLDFAGNSYVSTNLSLNNSSAFTISAWVNLRDMNGTQSLFGQNGVVEAYTNGNIIGCSNPTTGGAIGGIPDPSSFINQWHLITCTGDSTDMRFYLDGALAGGASSPGSNYGSSAQTFNIGGYVTDPSTPDYFSGKIDDVRVYNRVLSATEISQLGQGNNTTATWTGNASTDYNNPANWDISAVPDAFTNIVVPQASNSPQLDADTTLANLSLTQINSVFFLNGHNLTFNDGGTFSSQGILELTGSERLTNFTNDTDSGVVAYMGGAATTYSSLPTGYDYAGLTLDNGSTWNLPQNLTAAWLKNYDTFNTNDHAITLTGAGFNGGLQNLGTFNAGTSAINSSGMWWNQGTFNAGTSTVTLDGTGQLVAGDSTFYNLYKTASSADTLTFMADSTQTITNNLSLTGSSGGLLSLASMTPGTQWNIDPEGAATLSYLSIADSKNTSTAHPQLLPTNSTDDGNNIGWGFATDPPVTGGTSGSTSGSVQQPTATGTQATSTGTSRSLHTTDDEHIATATTVPGTPSIDTPQPTDQASLDDQPTGSNSSADTTVKSSASHSFSWWWLIIIVLVIGFFWWIIAAWRRRRKDKK